MTRVPSRAHSFRRPRSGATVEALVEEIAGLVRERQALQERGATPVALERNRIRIARSQWHLSHALIARYYVPGEKAA
jgi:hypothetical protein